MKIPNNLLPIHVMKNGFDKNGPLNHHTLYSTGDDLIYLCNISKDKLICHESSEYDPLELANYLAFCANNFPKAIELLKQFNNLKNLPLDLYCEDNILDQFAQIKVEEFLNKIKDK